jgi:TonB family protein
MSLSGSGFLGHSMNYLPMRRPDSFRSSSSWDEKPSGELSRPLSVEYRDDITQIANTLAAHGGGAVSLDLALDLVLNDVVEEARSSTGATGAAIALARDGQMVCRATTGGNAPDLGVRVETDSGLTGACLTTGEVQQCSDTESDPRVNAEACRNLGVRSMLILPLCDSNGPFGILEVLSARSYAFGEREIQVLQLLARRIAENKRGAEECAAMVPVSHDGATIPANEIQRRQSLEPESAQVVGQADFRRTDAWTSVLVVLVVAAAVALGIAIGWRGAANGRKGGSHSRTVVPSAAGTDSTTGSGSGQTTAARKGSMPSSGANSVPPSKISGAVISTPPSDGGLVVTENGKVIYRGSPSETADSAPSSDATDPSLMRVVHRVEPEYPPEARAGHIQGSVVLDVEVLGDGKVGNVGILTGDPLLAEAAVQAVKQWTYEPNVGDGRDIGSQTRVTITFTLPPS